MSDDEIIQTRPPAKQDTLLQERFYESIANQAALMDKLAQLLLTVELAIPGLYATALKLISDKKTLILSCPLMLAFLCWLAALIVTLMAVLPRQYQVNADEIRNSARSIETFFYKSARAKWQLLLLSMVFFIAGLCGILWDIFL